MKIKLIVELESDDDFDPVEWGELIELAVAESLPSIVFNDVGEAPILFSSFSVEVAK